MKIAIVISQFNKEISDNLLEGAKACFVNNNFFINDLDIFEVPGAFEIPSFTKCLLNKHKTFDAVVTFGSVIKGETAHFEYISKAVTDGIMRLSVSNSHNIPILYGILTTFDYKQALERSLISKKNKGGEVMQAAIDLVQSINKF